MILLLSAFIAAYYMQQKILDFPIRINKMTYQDYTTLIGTHFTFSVFLSQSTLQPKYHLINQSGFILLPIITLGLYSLPLPLIIIGWILIYLTLLDIHYYLTDLYGLLLIFLLSLAYLLFYHQDTLFNHLLTLFMMMVFFIGFIPLSHFLFKKEVLGLGDVGLFISLSLLFTLENMLQLMLIASLLGLLFSFIYFTFSRKYLKKLPFIPFITLSTFLLFIDKIE